MNKYPQQFSNLNREERIRKAKSSSYDLIVIGGGITGAGIALDASLRGLNVLLVEKNDFASGTSSKSTKLIHGGLRYLKQFEFGLVRETGLERAITHRNAIHLVHPENMLLPIVDKGTFNKTSASFAISVYDRLSSVTKDQRKQKLSKDEVGILEPLLKKQNLKSGIIYSEYRTDDARLTIEIIKAAVRNGAEVFNYLEVIDFTYDNGKINGIKCTEYNDNKFIDFKAKTIVNASGPWVDKLRTIDKPNTEINLQLSKGVHLVFDREKLPINNSIYFDRFDGRMLFAIPRGNSVYVGTTDTFYDKDLENLPCSAQDVQYILTAINSMFNITPLSIKDVRSNWVGLRPLIRKKGKGPSELSRKDAIFTSDSGLISIAGGKLTGYRKMAERIIDLVFKTQKRKYSPCRTKNYKIHHNSFNDYLEYKIKLAELITKYPDQNKMDIQSLLNTFGKDSLAMINNQEYNEIEILEHQVRYCINYESVYLPIDFINRRSGWLFFEIKRAKKHLNEIVNIFARLFQHDQSWINQNIEECLAIINKHSLKDLKHNLEKVDAGN